MKLQTLVALSLFVSACGLSESRSRSATMPAEGVREAPSPLAEAQEAPSDFTVSTVSLTGPLSVEIAADDEPHASPREPGEGERAIDVRIGESLVLLSRWSGLSVEAIAERNCLEVSALVYPGQALILPVGESDGEAFASARTTFQDDRLERYLDRHGGLVGVSPHVVETGETAWNVAKDNALPLWVLAAFNRSSDLDRIGIGEKLHVPVVGSTLAMTELGEAVAPVDSEQEIDSEDQGVNVDEEIASIDGLEIQAEIGPASAE
jgi:LysM repeat protein